MSEGPRITLVLEGRRFQVDKRRIIDKSRYFRSLFSHNFSDSKANEQTVRYDFDPSVVQDFCEWVEEEPPAPAPDESRQIKISLQKYLQGDGFQRLKQFLELSVIYGVEELSAELSDVVAQHWLQPGHLLDAWRTARELGLAGLADVALAASLERFAELPAEELLGLALPDFLRLAANVNAACDEARLRALLERRARAAPRPDDGDGAARARLRRLLRLLEEPGRRRGPERMACFFVEAYRAPPGGRGRELRAKAVYAFREGRPARQAFAELLEVWRVDEAGRDLAGVGLVGRGFSVYKIGGELKLGSCQFNMNVWRYCLISRKWYYLARLRKARRHMVAAIVDDKLVLVGGVGRYRLKTKSVEVLHLHSGAWSRGPDLAEAFTDTPPSCVMGGVLVICVSSLYMFDARASRWLAVEHEIDPAEFRNVTCLACHENTLFIGKEGGHFGDYEVAWGYAEDASVRSAFVVRAPFAGRAFRSACDKIHIDSRARLSGVVYEADKVIVECGTFDEDANVKFSLHDFQFPGAGLAPIACFDLTDPASLYSVLVD